jgi:hypothetical protein
MTQETQKKKQKTQKTQKKKQKRPEQRPERPETERLPSDSGWDGKGHAEHRLRLSHFTQESSISVDDRSWVCALLVAIGKISEHTPADEQRKLEATYREVFFYALKCHALQEIVVSGQLHEGVRSLLRLNNVMICDADVATTAEMYWSFQVAAYAMGRTVLVWNTDGSCSIFGPDKSDKTGLPPLHNAAHVLFDGKQYAPLRDTVVSV